MGIQAHLQGFKGAVGKRNSDNEYKLHFQGVFFFDIEEQRIMAVVGERDFTRGFFF